MHFAKIGITLLGKDKAIEIMVADGMPRYKAVAFINALKFKDETGHNKRRSDKAVDSI